RTRTRSTFRPRARSSATRGSPRSRLRTWSSTSSSSRWRSHSTSGKMFPLTRRTTMTLSAREVQDSLELFEIKPGTKVRVEILRDLLPDPSTALFFGKAYKLDYRQLSDLLYRLFKTTIIQTLLGEGDKHSTSLQDYIIDIVPAPELQAAGIT